MSQKTVFILVVCTALFGHLSAAAADPVRHAKHPVPGQYIVTLSGTDDPQAVGLETASLRGGVLKHVYNHVLHGFAIRLTAAQAQNLAADPRVQSVDEDETVTVSDIQYAPPSWGLDRIDQHTRPLDSQYSYPLSSTPVYVHVVDTGIRITHTEFGGRAFVAGDYVSPSNGGLDCNGHGTHVAGTIGGATYGVAKSVTLFAHRVLDCNGSGATSGIIAALDAITADVTHRPAVVNMSLGGSANPTLDDAVRRSIASGVTYVIAAGNSNVDASTTSPADVTEAITVGATDSSDTRASFSNFGSAIDLFAPGVSIKSAWNTSDTATNTLSGTSMATPHTAGVAALYLAKNPAATPAQVAAALVAAATPGVIASVGTGSPNALLYSAFLLSATAPTVTVSQPNGGEKLFTGTPYMIAWTAADATGLASFDVMASVDGGLTYTAVPGCTALSGSQRQCTWAAPGGVTSSALIKVVATNTLGDKASDVSNAKFSISTGTATITVTAPNTVVNWGRASTQQIRWSHNLGTTSWVRLEVSRDGGATFETIAASVKNSSSTAGTYDWQVTGPNSTTAIVRVTWTAGPASDVSNVAFTIADPYITVTTPSSTSTSWAFGSKQRQYWKTNLGPSDLVTITLSTDGGVTFPTTLGSGLKASTAYGDVLVPTLGAAITTARVRVAWGNAPVGYSAAATSPVNFRLEAPFITVTSPNGGELWASGTAQTIRWTSNLGSIENVALTLSGDGGATYTTTILASTPSDGVQSVTVNSAWVSPTAKVRVAWLGNATVADVSNATFTVQ